MHFILFLSVTFLSISMATMTKWLHCQVNEIIKNPESQFSCITWSYWIFWNSVQINSTFINQSSYRIRIWKVIVFNCYTSENFFHQDFLDIDMIYQRSRYISWFIYNLGMVSEYRVYFPTIFFPIKVTIKNPCYNIYGTSSW